SGVCVVIDPLFDVGCQDEGGGGAPPPPVGAQAANEPEQPVPVAQTSTAPRYDPRRIAVTFKRGVTLQTIHEVAASAGTTIEESVPKLHAYLLGVDPDRRADALRSLRSSSVVASSLKVLNHE